MSAQFAVLLSAEGAALEVPRVALRVLMMLVRFVSCIAPEKVVFVMHVHKVSSVPVGASVTRA